MSLQFKAVLALTYAWATIIGYLNSMFKVLIRYLMGNCPDTMTPVIGNREHPFKILMAGMEGNKLITNKVRFYLKNKWEKDFCGGDGGANLHELGSMLGTSFIWISYVLSDEEILKMGEKFNEETDKIYSIAINLKTSIIKKYKRHASDMEGIFMGNEEILFHQCPLPRNS